jgi:hypothetical protein
MSGALRVSDVPSSSSSAGWPGLLIAGTHTTEGAPSFAQFAKGGYHERMRNRVCAEEQELRRPHRLPPLRQPQRRLLQRKQGWGTLIENDVHKSR